MTTKTPRKVPAELLRQAEEALKQGTPLPSGVSYNAGRTPQIMAAEDIESMGDADEIVTASPPPPVQGQSER